RDGLTAVLPEARPRRALPTRSTAMLVVRDGSGRVLLERRPPTGVWARLWSLPEADDANAAQAHLLQRHDVQSSAAQALAGFVHTFSHYHLQVTPLLLSGRPAPGALADRVDSAWFAMDELHELGLPAPVRKLLA